MLKLTEVLVSTLHLLAVDVAMMGPLVCIFLKWRETARGDMAAGRLGLKLVDWSLILLTAGIVLGLIVVGILWATGQNEFFDALGQIPTRRLWFGVGELAFSYLCLGAYRALWDRAGSRRFWHPLLGFLASTNLMYHFPPLFTVIGVLATRPDLWGSQHDFVSLMLLGESLWRIVHHLLAACTVSGVAMIVLAVQLGRGGAQADETARLASWGAQFAVVSALLQVPTGAYLLVQIHSVSRDQLLGEDALSLSFFCAGVLVAIWLMHTLAAVAWGEINSRSVAHSVLLTVAVVLLMVSMRHRARHAVYRQLETSNTSASIEAETNGTARIGKPD